MHQETNSSVDTEKSADLNSEKIREITISEQSPKPHITGKFVFVLFCIGILVGDLVTYITNRGSLYDKLLATVIMLAIGVCAGLVVGLCNKHLFKK